MGSESFVEGDFEYAVADGQAWLLAYKGGEACVAIPENLGGYVVGRIGERAFYFSHITAVSIPSSVTSIGDRAFFSCSDLTAIIIPNSVVSIEESAFHYCHNLIEVTIGDSVVSIGEMAFEGCHSLSVVAIPKSVTSMGILFRACIRLQSIVVDGKNAHYSSVDGVLFNKDKTIVLKYPEMHAHRKFYTIPDSVTGIGEWAFADCSEYTGFSDLSNLPELEDYSGLTKVVIPNSVVSIGDAAFWGCDCLGEVIIPDSVTYMGRESFYGCSALKTIAIPNSLTVIQNFTFQFCQNLAEVVLGDSVTSIGDCAFENCQNLRVLTIPKSVESIGTAFTACIRLQAILVDTENAHYTSVDGVLFTKDKTKLLKYPKLYERGTFYAIPDSVTGIGDWAFADCCRYCDLPNLEDYSSLTEVIIPHSVTSIGEGSFYRCLNLREVIIPDSVATIGDGAFYSCESLTEVIIPDSVTSIGECAFAGCINLTEVIIPNSIASIGEGAFGACNLRKIRIVNSVTCLEDDFVRLVML